MADKEFFRKLKSWISADAQSYTSRLKGALIERWLELTEQLGSSLEAYQSAMDVRDDGATLTLVLRDRPRLASLVEFGQEPYDMRDVLLRTTTRSIRVAKDGHLYLYVPLRKTTRTIVDLAGSRVYRMAKAMGAYPGSKDRLPSGLTDKLQPFHATDPLAGMVRIPNDNGSSTYMTWRTISQAGRPWYHRGITARNLMAQVAAEAPAIARRLAR